MNVYDLYKDTLDLIAQEDNGLLRSEHFNRNARLGSIALQRDLVKYQTDPRLKDYLQSTEDLLSHFVFTAPLLLSNGRIAQPVDYAYYKNMRVSYDEGQSLVELAGLYSLLCEADTDPTINRMEIQDRIDKLVENERFVDVELLPNNKIARRTQSFIPGKRPSKNKPITEQVDAGFRVYPKSLGTVLLTYYRLPKVGKLVMTVDQTTMDQVPDLTASVNLDWPDTVADLLPLFIAQQYSINKREKDLFQMIDILKQKAEK